jgi:hypothetical protein
MQIPLTFSDVSLVLAVTSIVLMISSELSSPYYGHTNLIIDKKKLRNVAYATGILFLLTVAIKIYTIIATP